MIKKLLFLLVLLLTAATGAVAQTETLLTTITATAKEQASYSTANVATVSFSYTAYGSSAYLANWGWWGYGWTATVTAAEGYTITKCVFYDDANRTATDSEVPFVVETIGEEDKTPRINGTPIDGGNMQSKGIKKIEVYGYATYSVTLAEGTEDAGKWTISPTEAAEGSPVTVTYSGERKVKSVKAVKAAKPDLLSGVFSVSSTKKVNFSKGNLRYESSKWSFFDNQYDYYTDYSADAWDKFGWSTSATTYGMNTSTDNGDYSGDFVDWGATMGTGWFTLSSDEWTYLFNTRTVNGGTGDGKSYTKGQSVNGKLGLVIYPDNYTGAVYSGSDWATFESAGCVFLPAAAGYRYGSSLSSPGTKGYYWSATPNGTNMAYSVYFISGGLSPAYSFGRRYGCSVRLVREVATSDAAAKEPATVTTAPTGAAIVGVGKETALVSGGAAEGGTMMYKVTTDNTKPTSTDGFSEAVPKAEGITASGKVYVWYYVKGDDTHTDSEIAATAIVVPVADIVWDATNVSTLSIQGTHWPYEKEGITLSCNADQAEAVWADYGDPATVGIIFGVGESGGFTFTAPSGKAFKKIVMKAQSSAGWGEVNLGDGWTFVGDDTNNIYTVTWKDSAASSVELLTGVDEFYGAAPVKYIAFYLSE